jgi:hypothetical protein
MGCWGPPWGVSMNLLRRTLWSARRLGVGNGSWPASSGVSGGPSLPPPGGRRPRSRRFVRGVAGRPWGCARSGLEQARATRLQEAGREILRTSALRSTRKFAARNSYMAYKDMPFGRCAFHLVVATVIASIDIPRSAWKGKGTRDEPTARDQGARRPEEEPGLQERLGGWTFRADAVVPRELEPRGMGGSPGETGILSGASRRAAGPRDEGGERGLCLIQGCGSPFDAIHPSAWKGFLRSSSS